METAIKFKDPDSRVDYALDYTQHFKDGDTIVSAEIITPDGITTDSPTITNNKVTFWCSGGESGESYLLTCRTTSQLGRVEDHSFKLVVRQR
jgi:hypothetical protein